MGKIRIICRTCLKVNCSCTKTTAFEPMVHWQMRIDSEFDQWMDDLRECEREKVKTVLRGIERSFAKPWDYLEPDASVTQNVDDNAGIHELHLKFAERELVILFVVERRNILFGDYGELRDVRRRSILTATNRFTALRLALIEAVRTEVSHV